MDKILDDKVYSGDLVMLFLDPCKTQSGVARPSIICNFVKQSDLASVNVGMEGGMLSIRNIGGFLAPFQRSARIADIELESVDFTDERFVEKYINFRYATQTQQGDCMSPFLLEDNRFQNRRIFGVHTSAHLHQFTRQGQVVNMGEGWIVTQEDLKRVMKTLPGHDKIYVGDTDAKLDASTVEMLLNGSKIGSITTRIGLEVLGSAELGVRQQTQTKIIPSRISDAFAMYGYPKKMPSALKPVVVGDAVVDPMTLGTTKYAKVVPLLDSDLVRECVKDVANNFYYSSINEGPLDFQRVLTDTEMFEGNRDILVEPLNRSTSMGYPFAQLHRGANGKRIAFGVDEWTYDTPVAKEIIQAVNDLERDCEDGIQRGVVWTDTLKDEKRPVEKVSKGKTRVFTAGPVHYTLLFRKYFGGFTGWIMRNHIYNEIAVGTNVYSGDWNEMAKYLLRNLSPKTISLIAGDFENYDGSENSQILWAIFEEINQWYLQGYYQVCKRDGVTPDQQLVDRWTRIRRILWAHIVNAVHINNTVMYQCSHSIPSGCPITAVLNSIYGSTIVRIAYLILAFKHANSEATMQRFRRHIRAVVYGDDNLISVHPDVAVWFNQENLTEAFLKIGHVYTDEAKTGAIYEKRLLTDVAFLKRKFVYSPLSNRWIAPLDLDSVLETPLWTKAGTMADTITLDNVEQALNELSLHGEEVYDRYGNILVQRVREEGFQYRMPSWREMFRTTLSLQLNPFSVF